MGRETEACQRRILSSARVRAASDSAEFEFPFERLSPVRVRVRVDVDRVTRENGQKKDGGGQTASEEEGGNVLESGLNQYGSSILE